MPIRSDSTSRCSFREPLHDSDIDALAADPQVKHLQTSEPASLDTWRRINDQLLALRPDVEVRIYGFYRALCDLSFVPLLSNVRRFAADSLHGPVSGLEFMAALPSSLESLSVGMWGLRDFGFLESVTPSLKSLHLAATKSKRPSLAPLARFSQLETLYLEGHQKRIEVISELVELRDVTLRSISTPGLDYLRPLHKMWSLDLKLGGIRDLSAIAGMDGIGYFEAWQVRGLSDLSAISELHGLQHLFLQSLPHVNSLPSLRRLSKLRRVVLMNMTGLHDFAPLESAPFLEEFALIEGQAQQPTELEPVLRNPALRRAQAGFGSLKRNRLFESMRSAAEVGPFKYGTPFEYESQGA